MAKDTDDQCSGTELQGGEGRAKGIGRFQHEERALTMSLLAAQRAEMEWSDYEQRGKGNPAKIRISRDSEDCGIIEAMKTLENKAPMTIYRKDLTLPNEDGLCQNRKCLTGI